jgi:hypothetical protein
MAELNAIENIQAIRLDVTDQAQIDAAVKTIEAGVSIPNHPQGHRGSGAAKPGPGIQLQPG